MSALYGRRASLQVGTLLIPFDGNEGLRITFRVSRNVKATEPNTAHIAVFNLSDQSRAQIAAALQPLDPVYYGPPIPGSDFVELQAGYGGSIGRIFKGRSVSVTNTRKGPDWVTEILAKDGQVTNDVMVRKTLPRGLSLGAIVSQVASEIKRTVSNLDISQVVTKAGAGDFAGATHVFSEAFSVSGLGMKELDKMLRPAGVEISEQDGKLILLDVRSPLVGKAIELSDSTGLIGAVDPVKDDKLPGAFIIKARTLLRHELGIGSAVAMSSSSPGGTKGVFKIRKLVVAGDTHGGEWMTEFEAVEIETT